MVITPEHEKIINTILTYVHKNSNDFIYASDLLELLDTNDEKLKLNETLSFLMELDVLTRDTDFRLIPGKNKYKYQPLIK